MSELADTSAWGLSRRDLDVRRRFDQAVFDGRVDGDAVKLELLYEMRNGQGFSETRTALDLLPQCTIGPREWRRALDVYETLAYQGGLHHRRVKTRPPHRRGRRVADVPLLHYDADFDVIAEITGQPTRWIAPRGSL